jgi:hypothetical protein
MEVPFPGITGDSIHGSPRQRRLFLEPASEEAPPVKARGGLPE